MTSDINTHLDSLVVHLLTAGWPAAGQCFLYAGQPESAAVGGTTPPQPDAPSSMCPAAWRRGRERFNK